MKSQRSSITLSIDGNLIRDPEIKVAKNMKDFATFSIAVNHYSQTISEENKDSNLNSVSYFDVVVWGERAKACKHLKKGSRVTIKGFIKQERWKSLDGTNRQKVKIIAEDIRFDRMPSKSSKDELAA